MLKALLAAILCCGLTLAAFAVTANASRAGTDSAPVWRWVDTGLMAAPLVGQNRIQAIVFLHAGLEVAQDAPVSDAALALVVADAFNTTTLSELATPDLAALRDVLRKAAVETLGAGNVRRVLISQIDRRAVDRLRTPIIRK